MDYLEIPGYGTFDLILPLVGFKRALQARIKRFPYAQNVFLMMKFRKKTKPLSDFILQELKRHGFRGVRADDADWNITQNVYNPIACLYCCRFGLALFDQPEKGQTYSPNVAYELGMMHYQNKNCLILKHADLPPVPFDLVKDLHRRYTKGDEVREIIGEWVRSIENEVVSSAYDKTVSRDKSLETVIDFSAFPPAVRGYLKEKHILFVSDAPRIDFDDMVKQKGIGRIGRGKLVAELISKGILRETKYLTGLLRGQMSYWKMGYG